MDSYIEITKLVKERVPLTRSLTKAEVEMIKNDEMFDMEDAVIDWGKSEVMGEDYSYSSILIVENGKERFTKRGRYEL